MVHNYKIYKMVAVYACIRAILQRNHHQSDPVIKHLSTRLLALALYLVDGNKGKGGETGYR